MEDHPNYVAGDDAMMMSSPQLSHNLLVSSGPYSGGLDTAFYNDQPPMGWPKMEYGNPPDLPGISSLPIPHYDRGSESPARGSSGSQAQRRPNGVPRTRTRRLTSKEDANFQCHVKGCGKLFGRSYNFKAHMETHDASREYPFPCPVTDCNKKFVRKTDLQRHHQSVHMKQRNHRCDYCSRFFARKDTLRRHMEDGCSKRFDIETVDFRPQSYNNSNDQHSMRVPTRTSDNQSRQASYSSGGHYSPPPGSSTSRGPHVHDNSLTSVPVTVTDKERATKPFGPTEQSQSRISNINTHHLCPKASRFVKKDNKRLASKLQFKPSKDKQGKWRGRNDATDRMRCNAG
ncbi:hypothetical protein EG329_010351 [Mollisiaceae sp. DMI_Dod_QoI]|nr:hypothetical protein EG329_010351 [Helotiales sp. DMI_Dod_QoI]